MNDPKEANSTELRAPSNSWGVGDVERAIDAAKDGYDLTWEMVALRLLEGGQKWEEQPANQG